MKTLLLVFFASLLTTVASQASGAKKYNFLNSKGGFCEVLFYGQSGNEHFSIFSSQTQVGVNENYYLGSNGKYNRVHDSAMHEDEWLEYVSDSSGALLSVTAYEKTIGDKAKEGLQVLTSITKAKSNKTELFSCRSIKTLD